MLSQFLRFRVINNSGQTVTFNNNGRLNLKVTGWIIDPTTGNITYTQLSDDDLAFIAGDSFVDGGEETSSEIDNTSTLYIGFQVQLEITHDEGTLADGAFDIYLDEGDATSELQSDASGYNNAKANGLEFVGFLIWESNGLDDEIMRSNVFNI